MKGKEEKKGRVFARAKNQYTNYHVNQATTLMEFLESKMPDASRTTLKKFLSQRQVFVNKRIETQYNYPLEKGMLVQILNTKHKRTELKSRDVNILYEDAYIFIVEKRPGILDVTTSSKRGKSIHAILSSHMKTTKHKGEVFLIHKLEQEESGIMIFAKDEKTKHNFQENWKRIVINYTLVGLVEGEIPEDKGTVASWVENGSVQISKNTDDAPEDAIKAVTKFRTIKRANGLTMLEFDQLEDRNNKIQIQMAHIGYPLLGDRRFGQFKSPLKRMALHAFLLRFRHPISGELLKFELPYPKEFRALMMKQDEQEAKAE